MNSLALGRPLLRGVNVQKGGLTWPSELPLACSDWQINDQYGGNFYFTIKRGIAFIWG